MSDRAVLVFTKPAIPGRVKTRLLSELTPEEAACLHAAFLEDLVDRLRAAGHETVPCWALDEGEPVPAAPSGGARQSGSDLGERLYRAFRDRAGELDMMAIVGSDHPDLPVERVARAFRELEAGTDLVLGPARDGGYYLIAAGAGAAPEALFREVPWSTPEVLATTLERARELGLSVVLLEPGEDVDEPDDLRRLEQRLAGAPAGHCPRSRAVLEEIRRGGRGRAACAS